MVGKLRAMIDTCSDRSNMRGITQTQISNSQSSIELILASLSMLPSINIFSS